MRRKVMAVALASAFALSAPAAASAAITQSSNNGHPNTNPSGGCPGGHNKDATPGALNKCD